MIKDTVSIHANPTRWVAPVLLLLFLNDSVKSTVSIRANPVSHSPVALGPSFLVGMIL